MTSRSPCLAPALAAALLVAAGGAALAEGPASPVRARPASPSKDRGAGPPPAAADRARTAPRFHGAIGPVPADVRARMRGVTWAPTLTCGRRRIACPPLDDLRLVRVTHWTFDGEVAQGTLVLRRDVAEDVLGVFEALFDARFPIRRIEPASAFGGDDDASMAADNTSAFNCRCTAGGGLSEHAAGRAVDVNPVENPYVGRSGVQPASGAPFADRAELRPGMVRAGGPAVRAFEAAGWGWGGRWRRSKDYQHFSASGR